MVELPRSAQVPPNSSGRSFIRNARLLSTFHRRKRCVLISYYYRVKRRPHRLQVEFTHHAPAYLDEHYPIMLEVTNIDDRELEISVDVLLQPGEDDSGMRLYYLSRYLQRVMLTIHSELYHIRRTDLVQSRQGRFTRLNTIRRHGA